jgi:hypothetical protein
MNYINSEGLKAGFNSCRSSFFFSRVRLSLDFVPRPRGGESSIKSSIRSKFCQVFGHSPNLGLAKIEAPFLFSLEPHGG